MTLAAFTPDPEMLRRVRQMHLLGFEVIEMLAPLEGALGRSVIVHEVQDTLEYLQASWRELPEADTLITSESELWDRSSMFRRDLLALYQDQLANARATMEGVFSHPDGRPVISTKPAEVLTLAEKLLKLERDAIEQKRAVIKLLGAAASPAPSSPPSYEGSEEDFDEEIEIPRTDLI